MNCNQSRDDAKQVAPEADDILSTDRLAYGFEIILESSRVGKLQDQIICSMLNVGSVEAYKVRLVSPAGIKLSERIHLIFKVFHGVRGAIRLQDEDISQRTVRLRLLSAKLGSGKEHKKSHHLRVCIFV